LGWVKLKRSYGFNIVELTTERKFHGFGKLASQRQSPTEIGTTGKLRQYFSPPTREVQDEYKKMAHLGPAV
jgi:hypothetical protein